MRGLQFTQLGQRGLRRPGTAGFNFCVQLPDRGAQRLKQPVNLGDARLHFAALRPRG